MVRLPSACALCLLVGLGACGSGDDGTLDIAFIAGTEPLFASEQRLSEPAQHVRAATALGLVARDAAGEIVPALADQWIVTDDGLSFIFRLRSGTWPDGEPLTARSVRAALLEAFEGLEGTPMELDLAPIDEVRAMAGRVIEVRLAGPFPTLLQLLAQPELALRPGEAGGDMTIRRREEDALLVMRPPEERGLPEDENWQQDVQPVRIEALDARAAIAAFDSGEADVVLGGRIATLPLVETGPLSLGTVRLDPAIGLFGLYARNGAGPLGSAEVREAISMAIDRAALIAPFNIGGWTATTRVIDPALAADPLYMGERWTQSSIEDLRSDAARRVAAWRAEQASVPPGAVVLTLEIDDAPGLDLLLNGLSTQLASIGIRLIRVPAGERGDLVLVDQIARYAEPRWFLSQFACALRRGLCDEDVDFLVELAVTERDPTARATLLAEAEAELAAANVYIPFGPPVRWSLIRGNVEGFVPNPWAFHPLPPLAQAAR
jgi:oligopeptide transport system substrate-binding protein